MKNYQAGDYAAIVVAVLIYTIYASVIGLHVYGCWLIGGFIGFAAFFFPPIPALVAIASTLGLI
jgi:hypothetical protein